MSESVTTSDDYRGGMWIYTFQILKQVNPDPFKQSDKNAIVYISLKRFLNILRI